MKITKKAVSIVLAAAVLLSCVPATALADEGGGGTAVLDSGLVQADQDWLTFDVIKMYNLDAAHIMGGLNLPTSGENGCAIAWESTVSSVVSTDPDSLGEVTRPSAADGNKEVTLTATLTSGSASGQRTFNLTVLALEPTDISLNELHARQDYNWLTYPIILNKNENDGIPPDVTTDLSLPEKGESDSAISWTTSDESVVSPDGAVTRPQQSMADSRNNSYLVTLTAKIMNGDCILQKSMPVYVACLSLTGDAGDVDMACGALTANLICGFNTPDCVLSNLTLPTEGSYGCSISWASSDESVVAEDGTVVQPAYSLTGYRSVTLTATVSKNDAKQTKQFTIRVLSTPSDDEGTAAQNDATWLTGEGELTTILNGNTDADTVTANLSLPIKGTNGSTISWSSGDPSVVAADGTVTCPVGYESQSVTLTATVTDGEAQVKRKITLSILPSDGTADGQDVGYDYNCLSEDSITYGHEDADLHDLTDEVLWLPQDDAGSSFYTGKGCAVSWRSSDPSILKVVKDDSSMTGLTAVPHRPSFLEGNKTATLTATITKGDASREKSFQITVAALEPEGAEAIELDKEWLTDALILNGNSADDVKRTLNLPTQGKYGSQISWQSSSVAVDPDTGKVIRPEQDQSDADVTLTAKLRVYNDDGRAAEDTKIFQITVTKRENSYLAIVPEESSGNFQVNGTAGAAQCTTSGGKTVFTFQDNAPYPDYVSGGSVFAKDKIHLGDDLSFSTSFTFQPDFVVNNSGEGGITFTLQTAGADQYGTGETSLGVSGISPSVSVGLPLSSTGGTYSICNQSIYAFYNGNTEQSLGDSYEKTFDYSSTAARTVWIDYNGAAKTMELRIAAAGSPRPEEAFETITGADLGFIFRTGDGTEIQDVYAGFTGGAGRVKSTYTVSDWSLQSGSTTIDAQVYDYTDVSRVGLPSDQTVGTSTFSVDASVQDASGNPVSGIPVAFTSTYGTLSASSAVTDSTGKASVTLTVENAGLAQVEAVAPGGACACATYGFAFSDADSVALDKEWLQTEGEQKAILNKNSGADNILTDLFLPGTGLNGSTITWTSDNAAVTVDGEDGKVTLPTAEQGDQAVTLTASIAKGSASDSTTFSVTVRTADTAFVLADFNALTDSVLVNGDGDTDLTHVTKDLTLPVQGANGSTITWASSQTGVIDKTGKVTRPDFLSGNRSVTLYAMLKRGSVSMEKEFHVTVLTVDPTDQQAVQADANALTESAILNGNISADSITGSLCLPASGANGSTITWSSSNPLFLAADGSVNCPAYSAGDQCVTLTATLMKGAASTQKKFSLTVKRLDPTGEELLFEGCDWLNESRTLGADNLSQYAVTSDLTLPAETANGLSVTWESSAPDIISDNGAVTRPAMGANDRPVTLTATVSNSFGFMTKQLHYTVLALPDVTPPYVTGSSPKETSQAAYDMQKITLTFSEKIVAKNLSGVKLEGPDVPEFSAMVGKDADGVQDQLVITLSGELDPSSQYTLTVPKDAVNDLAGNPINADYVRTFTVEKKTVRTIGIVSTTPADGTADYAGTGLFTIQFDSTYSLNRYLAAGPAFGSIRIVGEDGTEYTAANADFLVEGSALYLRLPNGALKPGYLYQIVIPEGAVQDYYKNVNTAKAIQFRTYTGSVNVFNVYPSYGSKSVDVHQDIFFSVSGGSSLDTSGVVLKDGGGNAVEASVSRFGLNPYNYAVRPVKPLQPNTAYTLTIGKNALTKSGGTSYMSSDYTLKFTTGSNSLPVQSTSPAALEQQAAVGGEITIHFPSAVVKAANTYGISIVGPPGNKVDCSSSVDGETVTMDTASPLTDGGIYTVTLPAGAYESGGKQNDTLQFRFMAAYAIDPTGCSFTVDPSNIQMEGDPISFGIDAIRNKLRLSGYKPASTEWDFGDGSTSKEESPSHTYAAEGQYTVKLTVTDDKGHSYTWNRVIHVLSYSSGQFHLSVSPGTNTACFLTDANTSGGNKVFTVHLTYGDAETPLLGKFIQADLYQNGKFVRAACSGLTEGGTNAGTVSLRFDCQYDSTGTYELRFWYGTEEDQVTASVPITIYNKRSSQDLKLELYSSNTGDLINFVGDMYFLLDGKKVRGYPYRYSSSSFGVMIPNVPLGEHSLEFISAAPYGEFAEFTYIINPFTVNHTGETISHPVKAIPKQPGVISVTSDSSDSNSTDDAVFIYGEKGPMLTLTVKGDWDGMNSGRYILKTSGGKILNTYSTSFIRGDPSIIKFYNFYPAYALPVGERLLVGMETMDGRQSSWVDCKIKTIASPESALGIDNTISYEDGKYTVQNWITLPTMVQSIGQAADLVKSIPGLSGALGLEDEGVTELMGGAWDGKSKVNLTFDFGADFSKSKKTQKKSKKAVVVTTLGTDVDVDLNGEYDLNYNDSTNQWEVYYQRFTLQGDVTKTYGKSIKIPKTGISAASMTVKLGVLIGGSLVFQGGSDLPNAAVLNFSPHLDGDVTVGLDWADIQASLGASVPCELDFPTEYFEVDPNATFKVTAKFLLYSTTLYKKTFDTEWDNGKTKINLMSLVRAGASAASNDLETSPRGYLTRPFQWLVSAVMPRLLLAKTVKVENPSVKTLAQNVYPNADVQLVQSNGKLYAIWTDDNPARSDENRTQLRCSVYENGAWSPPAWLGADATGDFSPAAAAAGDGTLIAWQDMKKEMTSDADADEASRNCEISVSKDPLTSDSISFEAVRLTDDDEFDHSPKIASDGDSALVAWTKSDGLSLDGTATHDKLYFAQWKDSGWSGAEQLADVGHTVINSTLAMHDGTAVLLYTVDTDDNLSTSDDQEIYAVTWDGSSWGTPVRLTDNSVEDSSPQATYANGGWLIVWNQNSQTVYRAGLDGATKTADAVTGAGNKFQLVSTGGDDPQVTLVYTLPGDNGTRGLAESTYDTATGLWGNEKVLTDGTDGYTGSFCPVDTDDGQLKIFYTQADMVTESIDGSDYYSASDKADLELLTYTPAHDLALDADEGLQLSSGTPVAGVRETVTATVDNLGDYAENATVSLYRGDPANGGVKVAQSETVPVAAHASAQVDIPWQVASDFTGSCGLYAVVSPAEGITDSDESNNTVSRTVSTSDLGISDARGNYIAGNKYEVTADVKNNGSDVLKNVVLNLTDDESGKTLGTETINELDPGMTGGFDQIVSVDGLTKNSDGNYSVTLKAVLPEGVTDNNTDDNTDSFTLEVPSITVNSVTPAPNAEQVELQQPIAVTFHMEVRKGGGFDGIRLTDSFLNPVEITTALDGNTLTVTPKGTMTKGAQYTLTIPDDAVVDSYGHTMEAYTLPFTTVTSSPAVVYADPGEQTENASADSDIRLKYNQTVNRGSGFSGITVTDGNSQKVSVTAAIEGQWLTLHPGTGLSDATQYNVTIPAGAVKNASGEVQQQVYSYSFTTESANNTRTSTSDHVGTDSGETEQAAPSGQSATFRSDTTATYRFGQNAVYYYKITTTDATPPTAVSSDPLVATVELAERLPDGYLFRVTDVGEGTAVITTTLAGSGQTSFLVQGAVPQGIVSDTPFYHSMERGSTYQFKFTLPQGSPLPSFTSGNGQIVRPVLLRRDGNACYFKVLMLTGGSAGVYLTLPGSSPVLRCVLSSSR